MLKIVIGTNEGKVLCISNNENKIKESMVNYLIDTDQEPTEDFFESRNWGEYDIEVYEYHQPQLNENQQIVLERLKELTSSFDLADAIYRFENSENWGESEEHYDLAYEALNDKERLQVIQVACQWALEQEAE